MDNNSTQNMELKDALKKSLSEAQEIIKQIRDELMKLSHLLRIEQTDKTFIDLSESFRNFSCLMDYINVLREGITYLKDPNISIEPLLCWDRSISVLKEMLTAFENKDWITLSDLIQYEISPLLIEGEKGLFNLKGSFGVK